MVCQDLFLGFDLSTQQLKVISSFANLRHHATFRVDFDSELSHFNVKNGVHIVEEEGSVSAPVEMWVEAIDLVFSKMQQDQFPFHLVKGISGSCQQHGSVYWSAEAENLLNSLVESQSLSSQLCPNAFTFKTSPNWQDHSTGPELEAFEKGAGGADALAEITGSRAHYRFTGPQIRKLSTRKNKQLYRETSRISLVSSFLASVLCGKLVSIEESDGCGMNLYDMKNNRYDPNLLAIAAGAHPDIDGATLEEAAQAAQDLERKLGPLDPIGHTSIGNLAPYFHLKYGFSKECQLFPFTGDNLATILALPLATNDILVSLGTSTTVLLVTDQYISSPNYHMFKHPTLAGSYMGMLCYCNGALPRDVIRQKVNAKYNQPPSSWDKFNEILDSSLPLHHQNRLAVYFSKGEIIPNCVAQTRRFQYNIAFHQLTEQSRWDVDLDVGSIVESQALSCRLRLGPMLANNGSAHAGGVSQKVIDELENFGTISSDGIEQNLESLTARPNNVFYVGGGSNNRSIVNKFSSIFGSKGKSYKIDLGDACALGGCYKAAWSSYASWGAEHGADIQPYNEFLSERFDWGHSVEQLSYQDRWNEYVEGVGILSKIEMVLK